MVELQHGTEPAELAQFCVSYPQAEPQDFDKEIFASAKRAVRACLHRDQGGLCVYCETPLEPTRGQVDHIKPRGGNDAHPHLSFVYINYAHSCINNQTCGQKKKSGILPIAPAPGCNAEWTLSTDGTIEPLANLDRQRRQQVTQTRDMLGLNKDAALVDERKKWFANALAIAQIMPGQLSTFLQSAPYRYIMGTAL
jgi:uncharacterized protein (TIGR02646 family)